MNPAILSLIALLIAIALSMATKLNAAVYSTNATGAVAWPSPHSHFETG